MAKIDDLQTKELEYAHLGLDFSKIDFNKLRDPFASYYSREQYMEIMKLIRDPKNFYFTCKYILNIEPTLFQLVWLDQLWKYPFPMIIANRGASKTFTTALYYALRATITQGCKIVITSASFRQAKLVYEYIETIWNNAPVWRDLVGGEGPRRGIDKWEFKCGKSTVTAIPLGTGEKIRGLRANYLDVEEFDACNEEIFEIVVRGFTATASNPVENIKNKAKIKKLKDLGIWSQDMQDELLGTIKPNQIILSGTSGWDFMHFAKYWKRYKKIITSRGDVEKLTEALGSKPEKGFDWRHYCVIRIPVDLLPDGMMDETAVANAKATMDPSRYDMEFGACSDGNTEVITDQGIKAIKDIEIGDNVLTHKGRFRPVEKLYKRKYDGLINKISYQGNNIPLLITPEHPFYCGNDKWDTADNINHTTQSNLKKLNNKQNILISDYTYNFNLINHNNTEYIYPWWNHGAAKPGKGKYNKSCFKNKTKLDYNFGLIIGYYLSEGNIGASGRSIEFSLDGHVNQTLQFYISELENAIYNVFDKYPKKSYRGYDNTCRINLNSRILADLIKYICPGVSHTKYIKPEILYSNEEFMKGFLTGYWHGDGSISICSKGDTHIKAGCVNKSLLSQVKTVINYFGFKASLLNIKNKSQTMLRGKVYNTRQAYVLTLNRQSHQEFIKFLDNIDYYPKDRLNEMQYKITNKEKIHYNDYVYNLHVEEDESYSLINSTIHNCFSKDSNGFFPRSLIEACTCKQPIQLGNEVIKFSQRIRGDSGKKYVISIDPASESDNLAITIIEINETHNRIVYCWTAVRKDVMKRFKEKETDENNFYAYIARKVRKLMQAFNVEYIALDTQGGGIAVSEALHDLKRLEPGELPIWPLRKDDPLFYPGTKDYGYDDEAGLHIIEMVQMANANYVLEANHGLRKDLMNKTLLFPHADAVVLACAEIYDENKDLMADTLQDCVYEIEELKEELSIIVHSATQNGRDRWDTPDIILPGGKKGKVRKDRYSSLLMGNMLARRLNRPSTIDYSSKAIGGFADQFKGQDESGQLYIGPAEFVKWANESILGAGVNKKIENDPFGYYHR